MTQNLVTLNLPDELYERVQREADARQRSIESLVVETLDILFDHTVQPLNLDQELEELADYTDTQLWAVVHRRLSWQQSLRLHELNAKAKLETLSEAEDDELEHLLALNDGYMLLRSDALLKLKQRGHDIDAYLKIGA